MSGEAAELECPVATRPADWTEVTLGDIIVLEYGKSLPDKSRRHGTVPVYGSNGVVGWHDEPFVTTGGIIVGRKGTAGSVTVSADPFWPIDTTYFVKARQTLDWDWLAATLQHVRLNELNEATGVPGLNRDKAYRQPILLPPPDEQRRIAEVLRSVDEAITAASEVSNATQLVFASVRAELLEAARATCDEVVVADAIAKNRGQKLTKLQTSDYLDDGAFPIIDQGAAFVCGFSDDETALWPYDLPVIVFGDHTRILKYVDFPFVIGADGTQCITPAAGFDARYSYYALQSLDLRGEGYARHFKLLKEKSIPMPSMSEQNAIAEQLCSLENAVAAADATTERLIEAKRALMSDLLSGRVRVPA